jgi:hypothetical protein
MGYVKEMWIAAHEKIGEDYAAGEITRDEAVFRMGALGFYAHEIEEQLSDIESVMGPAG